MGEAAEEPLISPAGSDGKPGATDLKKSAVKYANTNKRYWNHLKLALATASYVTIFGLPVYSQYVSYWIFGEKEALANGEYVRVCGPNKLGPKVDIGNASNPILVNYNSTFWKEGREIDAWCGFLPASYFASWPSVVQTAIFTIYMNTGSTVKLAWQCIAGTFTAILNIYLLNVIFYGGADADNYNEVVAWLDLCVVLFLFLASKADTNTQKMGMNWTVCLMLHFMKPGTGSTLGSWESPIPYVNWDAETTVVMLTSIMGCMLAILATSFPMVLFNISHVHDDATAVTHAIDDIFQESIDYWAGAETGPKQFRIAAKMNALSAAVKRVEQNLADSFWETFDFFKYGSMRKMYFSFSTAIQQNDDEIYLVKEALETINFDDTHNNFVSKVRKPLQALKDSTVDCLRDCAQCCKDGLITPDERGLILQKVEVMEKAQKDLSTQFQLAKKHLPYVSMDLSADSLFVFSVSQWAREIADFGRVLAGFEDDWETSQCSNPCKGLATMAIRQFKDVFDPKEMFSAAKVRYALQQGLPILITFAMAIYLEDCPVVTPYSHMMPGTLTLLVTGHGDYGYTFVKNVMRLMGVVFGQTLPLLVMAFIGTFPCESNVRFVLHVLSLFVFNAVFSFVYYSSEQWSIIGLCIVGFGCYPMFHQCDGKDVIDQAAQYIAIAEVIIAIVLKMIMGRLLAPGEPRDYAKSSLEKLTTAVKAAYTGFLKDGAVEDPVTGLKARRDEVRRYLQECEDCLPKCDPSLQVVTGMQTPFKHKLFGAALVQFRLVLSDLDMLVLAMTGHEVTRSIEVKAVAIEQYKDVQEQRRKDLQEQKRKDLQEEALFELMSGQLAWDTIVKDLASTIDNVFDMLMMVLKHDTEEPLEDDAINQLLCVERILELDGVTEFYEQVSQAQQVEVTDEDIFKDTRKITQLKRTRLNVVIYAFVLSVKHIGQISAACFNHMVYY